MIWLTAEEALSILQTKPQTLYANVSRGRIRSKPLPDDPRRSLYRSEDVHRLAERRPGRKRDSVVAADTIRWGLPIMRSGISTIVDGRLLYRGRDAVELSETATLEEVAALLWQMNFDTSASNLDETKLSRHQPQSSPLERLFTVFAIRAANDLPSSGRSAAILQQEAFALLQLFHNTILDVPSSSAPMHERIASAWQKPRASDVIRRVLVLLADHELNASAFATRVAASTGAPLSAAVLAGLSTLIGPRHGRAATAATTIIAQARQIGAEATIKDLLRQGAQFHLFGHPLYGETGDIRASAMLKHLELPAPYRDLEQSAADILGEKPNVDFALAAVTEIYGLPSDAPLLLFALARIAGWLAHALEQADSGSLIRPRAEFTPPLE
ncbi:citrate synthase [Brucella sp. ZJ1_1]|uniref:citrate synthase (unknown stereospecificity) n=1 Tax=Brucella intermedia M86 TaxID=1234597 RepID=M5K4U3_9HYPH|nr:citrate synthase [Brucella intermedia]ELT50911.1 citrate synthase [Brucella intermedia M86]MCB4917873.1 citrate synthase [Brucella intermedia]NKB94725.1 citrate synthase [Brucella intermedia]OOC50482.1 citrate synthase [Brucella intermedia M86]SUB12798.1 Citrate synthase 2 [Brucella intermedia]